MKCYIVLGDWSQDGHNQYNKILVDINIPVDEMQKAFILACKKFKVSFDCNDDGYKTRTKSKDKIELGVDKSWGSKKSYQILCAYGSSTIPFDAYARFRKDPTFITEVISITHPSIDDVDEFPESFLDEDFEMNEDSTIQLIAWLVKTELPSFTCTKVSKKDDIPCFNGYWGDLNLAIGYGLYE